MTNKERCAFISDITRGMRRGDTGNLHLFLSYVEKEIAHDQEENGMLNWQRVRGNIDATLDMIAFTLC